jgi:putative ABC transport system substrate-binding protein
MKTLFSRKRPDSTLALWCLTLVLLLSRCAEKPKSYRIGVLSGFTPFSDIVDSFKASMKNLGYGEGNNCVFDLQKTHAEPEKELRIITGFVKDRVDLIFCFPTEASLLAKSVVRDAGIPIVFAMAGVEGNGLIDSIRRPGHAITGVRYPGPDLAVKRFELLQELLPGMKKLWIAYNENYPANKAALEVLEPAVAEAGIELTKISAASIDGIRVDLQKRKLSGEAGMDAILIMPDDFSQSPEGWSLISKFAAGHSIPIAGSASFEADDGALFSLIPTNQEMGRLAATLADKILRGIPAGTVPVITPESYFRFNYTRACELGISVSEGFLALADEIIR